MWTHVSKRVKDVTIISPKHAMTKDFVDIEPGVLPEPGDPSRDEVMTRMALARHGLGVSIWLQNAYITIMRGTGALCKNMAHPHELTLKCLRYQTMFLLAHGTGITWGGFNTPIGSSGWPRCNWQRTLEDCHSYTP